MESEALAHPEQAQCLELHHSISSLSALNTVIPAKKSLPCVMTAFESLVLYLYGMGKFLKSQKHSGEEIAAADVFL